MKNQTENKEGLSRADPVPGSFHLLEIGERPRDARRYTQLNDAKRSGKISDLANALFGVKWRILHNAVLDDFWKFTYLVTTVSCYFRGSGGACYGVYG